MEELLILQEEQSLQKAKKFYNAIIAAANYIEFTKSENLEKVEDESQKYGKKLKPQLFS
jgi:hypothetical protein